MQPESNRRRQFLRRRVECALLLLTVLSLLKVSLIQFSIFPAQVQRLWPSKNSGPRPLSCEQQLVFKDLPNDLKIPRVIHFTAKSELMLESYKRYLTMWYKTYPTFTFYLWRDVDAACLLRLSYPQLLSDFENELKTPLERSDFIRALAVYHFGGLYVDLDTLPVRNMDFLFDQPVRGAMIAQEPEEHAVFLYNLDSLVSNAVMFGIPRHPFYYYYACHMFAHIRQLEPGLAQIRSDFDATHITGPILMNRVYHNYTQLGLCPASQRNCSVHLFQPSEFSPHFDTGQRRRLRFICIKGYRTLSRTRKRLCSGLLYRQFENKRLSHLTLAVHEFRHFSTRSSEAVAAEPAQLIDALTVIPTLRLLNSTEPQC